MNSFTIWLSENKLAASLAAVFLLCTGTAGWMTFSAWEGYFTSSQDYADAVTKLTKLNQQSVFPSEANKTQLESTLVRQQSELDTLSKSLQAYRIPAFHDLDKAKPQDRPQLFQDALRGQVTAVKAAATSKGVTIPQVFYLGMEEYENRPPTPEETVGLSKQLTVLSWIAEKLVSHQGVVLSEFSRVPPIPVTKTGETVKKPSPANGEKAKSTYDSVGYMKTSFRCDSTSLREFLNDISSAPYFLVIETIQVQNTVSEAPRRNAPPQTPSPVPASADGTQQEQSLPVIVGNEKINVSMKIRFLEFPPSPDPKQSQQPQRAVK